MSANSSGASLYAPHPTIAGLYVAITDSTSTVGIDPITFCLFRGVSPDTTANTYHHGCIAQVVSGTSGALDVYVNTGNYALPVWTNIGALPPGDIALTAGYILTGSTTNIAQQTPQYSAVSVATNGTTPVKLFNGPNPYTGSITSIHIVSGSTTSVNVTTFTDGGTLGAMATSTTKGIVTGSGNFNVNSHFLANGSITVVNSSNDLSATAIVTATFITPG